MAPSPADLAFVRFQTTGRPDALAEVFDRTAADLLRVAAHLTSDAHAAEDLVQETFLAAIESRGAFTAGNDVAAWLGGILRNRARRKWSAQARDADGEVTRGDAVARAGDPAAEVLAGELTAEVDAAIQHLPETYRPVLRLHLRHGLGPGEVALALDRPAGSVRTQLGRGLTLLRERLPRGLAIGGLALTAAPRGLAALRETVVDAAKQLALPTAAHVAVASLALALSMKKVLLLVAAAALVVLTGAWQLGAFASPATASTSEPVASLRADATPTPTPEVVNAPVPPPAAPTRAAVSAQPRTGRQYGSVLVRAFWKDDRTPAPEVTVMLFDWTKPDILLFTRAGVTGADGTVRIERVLAGRISVATNNDQWAGVVVSADEEATVDVLEPRWARVRGVVLDEAGAPVGGATVIRSPQTAHTEANVLAITRTDGRFAFALGNGQYVAARCAGYLDSYITTPNAKKGETVDVILHLRPRAGAIAGTVRDARGAPIRGALVTAGTGGYTTVLADGRQVTTTPPPLVMTGADGTFRLDGLAVGRTSLSARALDYGIAGQLVQVAAGETIEVAITLEDGAVVEGRVVDSRGLAVGEARLAVGRSGAFDSCSGRTAADGTFRLDNLPAGSVEINANKGKVGCASTTLELRAGVTTTWNVTLVAQPVLRGRVVNEAGVPVASVRVRVASLDANETREASDSTTADGTFSIDCERDEALRLRVETSYDTFPSLQIDEVFPSAEPLTVTLPSTSLPTARVRGVLVGHGADDLGNAAVLLHHGRHGRRPGFALDPATGVFSLGPFPPGVYRVSANAPDQPTVHVGTIRLEAGATLDLGRIQIGEVGSLRARVTGDDGRPLPSGRLAVLLRNGEHVGNGTIENGEARVAQVAAGEYLVHAQGMGVQRVTVRAGAESNVELRPRAGPLRDVTLREAPRPRHEPTRWVQVDVLDAAGVLVDRDFVGRPLSDRGPVGADREYAWRLRITTPPQGGGTLIVNGESGERIRLPLTTDGAIEATLR